MNFIIGFTILLLYQLLGEVISFYFDLMVPGAVVGMLLLLVSLLISRKIGKVIARPSRVLIINLSLLFVPASVGVINHLDLIKKEWLALSMILVISSILTLIISAFTMRFFKNDE